MNIAIIGGGIMGISLGYFLSNAGASVHVYEASPNLGGLSGQTILEDGTPVDRFYHAILSSDQHLHKLCVELGIDHKLRFQETQTGFYHQGKIHPMNNVVDFLRFPPLGGMDRLRLGLTILNAQLVRDWRQLEDVSVEQWLMHLSGRRTFENIWSPMLKMKFDNGLDSIPATYIWSRLVRMKSARRGANQKELVGHLMGGHAELIRAMAEHIERAGGSFHLNHPVDEIMMERGKAWGIRCGYKARKHDAIIATVQVPHFRRMIPDAGSSYHQFLSKTEYLGIISPILILDRPLSGYWTLYITEDRFPFTGIIETTTYIDPSYVGGHHLVYLPKYTAPGSIWQKMSDEDIQKKWLQDLERMFPHFNRKWIRHYSIHREQYVEPLHPLKSFDLIPSIKTPFDNLYLATTAQIYPALTNAESITRYAWNVSQNLLRDVKQSDPAFEHQNAKIEIDEQVTI